MTIQVKHEPRKIIIIHELATYDSPEEMGEAWTGGVPIGSPPPQFRWVNGVAFIALALPTIGDVATGEIVEGRLHLDHVSFAPMPQYRSEVTLEENSITIPVVDVSKNESFVAVANFLRQKLPTPKKKTK